MRNRETRRYDPIRSIPYRRKNFCDATQCNRFRPPPPSAGSSAFTRITRRGADGDPLPSSASELWGGRSSATKAMTSPFRSVSRAEEPKSSSSGTPNYNRCSAQSTGVASATPPGYMRRAIPSIQRVGSAAEPNGCDRRVRLVTLFRCKASTSWSDSEKRRISIEKDACVSLTSLARRREGSGIFTDRRHSDRGQKLQ